VGQEVNMSNTTDLVVKLNHDLGKIGGLLEAAKAERDGHITRIAQLKEDLEAERECYKNLNQHLNELRDFYRKETAANELKIKEYRAEIERLVGEQHAHRVRAFGAANKY
jgi:hypothetical protein